jgi:two-component system sensor histidine kinase HupT/HoxJ
MKQHIDKPEKGLLLQQIGIDGPPELDVASEHAWIEVIRKMDSVYADLVHYQVELERKNMELEQAQLFISSVLSSMTDVLIVCDTSSCILQVNKALEKLTGLPEDTIIGQPLGELFGTDSRIMANAFAHHLGSESLIDCEVNVRCSDGSTTPLAMNCSPRYDSRGRLAGAVIIGRAVGELRRAYEELNLAHRNLKQAQQQLVQSEKMASMGRLVAGVAHELNNPISFVFGNMHAMKRYGERLTAYMDALAQEAQSPRLLQLRKELRIDQILEDMNPLIDGTLEGAERVSDIVQDLRRYSSAQKEELTDFDLADSVYKAVEWVVKAGRTKPRLKYHMPEHFPYHGRKGEIRQILVNLVQNAIDAMIDKENPLLEITVKQDVETVIIQVADEGPGIAPDDMGKIFDPFYTSKPVGQGTGLGLYISYGLAQELGGSLEAGNRSNDGAIFTLTIPNPRAADG